MEEAAKGKASGHSECKKAAHSATVSTKTPPAKAGA